MKQPIIHRRLSDISFTIDKDLNIKKGNSSLLVLLHKTDFNNVNLSAILSDFDLENLRYLIKNMALKEITEPIDFIAKVTQNEVTVLCIFKITRADSGLFEVIIEDLPYSRQLLDKALIESREYSTVLKNFDEYYFVFDSGHFTLKTTKDLSIVFEGEEKEFRHFFETTFNLNTKTPDSTRQMDAMLENLRNNEAEISYNFFLSDKKILTVHTLKTSTRKKKIIVGNITYGKKSTIATNSYAEEHDGLTGLYNKKAITEFAIKKIDFGKEPCSLIIMDVDKFKECNDTFGHVFGDRVLVAVSSCIADAVKGIGVAGRIGGDEFLIILNKTEEADIRNVTRNIRASIQWNITEIEPGNVVTCSMGIARFPSNVKTYDELFKLADKCLYIAKNRGRNCYIIYKPEIHDKIITQNKKNDNKISTGQIYNDEAQAELEILNLLNEKKEGYLPKVLELLTAYLCVSKVSLYDAKLKPLYIVGKDNINFRSEALKESNYFSFYNKFGYLHLDNTNVLSSVDEKRYALYFDNSISSTIEVLSYKNGNLKSLVCYDIYRPAQTFAKDKITFALTAAKLISNTI